MTRSKAADTATSPPPAKVKVGVFGSWRPGIPPKALSWAFDLGQAIGDGGHLLVTGGSSGILLEARRGCREAGGINIGIIPESFFPQGDTKRSLIDIVVPTGLGALGRMPLLSQSTDVAFALAGGAGTFVEVMLTYLQRKPVFIVDGLQKPQNPSLVALLSRCSTFEIEGIEVLQGFLDGKPEDLVSPVYVVSANVRAAMALQAALTILARPEPGASASSMGPLGE